MDEQKKRAEIATYLIVYVLILMLAFMQVIFVYQMGAQLPLMLLLAIIQATLAVLFFMNLKRERTTLVLALIPALLFVLFQLNMIWSDSFRLLLMRPFSK
jgi:heme/copper-type cytochrome/quinol oxidase subunit 4